MGTQKESKTSHVKEFFENPEGYLTGRQYNLDIRAEAVRQYVGSRQFRRILDVGCGDGSMSLGLLNAENRLTLVDISGAMLRRARERVPKGFASQVETYNDDLMKIPLPLQSYDLIICLGVIAHVDSPQALIARLASLLEPGGTIIMESSDAAHFRSRMIGAYYKLCALRKPSTYRLTLTPSSFVINTFRQNKLALKHIYRYHLPTLPGPWQFLSQNALKAIIRLVYGSALKNRNAWLGRECIYAFQDERSPASSTAACIPVAARN
jgi:2-polyprenyl-3-methyl-5-hydroxy-6-metoxy-1,4-benzoquinol methylase